MNSPLVGGGESFCHFLVEPFVVAGDMVCGREVSFHGFNDRRLGCGGMMMIRNISEAMAEVSAPLEAVQTGDGCIVDRVPGSMAGEIRIADDFDVLPDDMAEAFGMVERRD